MRKDIEHLNLLAIFHYISAALTLGISLFPLIYVAFGVVMLNIPAPAVPPGAGGPPPPPPAIIGWMFIIGGSVASLLFVAAAIAIFIGGRCLSQQKGRIFCFVVAGILCLGGFPTVILGVFSLVVLLRPTVKDLFENKHAFDDPEDDRPAFLDTPPRTHDDRPAPKLGDQGIYSPRREDV